MLELEKLLKLIIELLHCTGWTREAKGCVSDSTSHGRTYVTIEPSLIHILRHCGNEFHILWNHRSDFNQFYLSLMHNCFSLF